MKDYWVNHYNVSVEEFLHSPLKQVGKTQNGSEITHEQFSLLIESVIQALNVGPEDVIADLCCGNGLITRHVASSCMRVNGIDFSQNLIRYAQKNNAADNIFYDVKDVTTLKDHFFLGISKVYMYEAIQYLIPADIGRLLRKIKDSKTTTLFYIAGVPDIDKFDNFYDTDEKRAFQKEREAEGRPHIGRWWSRQEIVDIVESFGMKATIFNQSPDLYTSHYRFDCLVQCN